MVIPANGDQGWFFRPVSDWEKEVVAANPEAQFDEEPVMGNTHLQQVVVSTRAF